MFDVKKISTDWCGRTLTLETGRMARQADGAVLATYGETSVLAAIVFDKTANPAASFFPLTVNYREKYYASGRIPGGYFKREGRPTEKETLTSRLIDRPVRPLFAKGFKNETQVTATVLSHDLDNDPDIVAMIASSAALAISGVPFLGPLGAARVGYHNGEYLINPVGPDLESSDLDLVVAGTADAVMMVESQARELSEDIMLGAVMAGHGAFQPIIEAIIRLAEQSAREPYEFTPADTSDLDSQVRTLAEDALRSAYAIPDKTGRQAAVGQVRSEVSEKIRDKFSDIEDVVLGDALKSVESDLVRSSVLSSGKRIDGRALDQVRPIQCDVSVLPRTHGSALFTRGATQALAVATLGTAEDEQFVDRLEGTVKERFLLHYNFPPFSVGETGRSAGPGRREIGHGKLAWRALHAVIPDATQFPYTLRIVSEIMESDGSSSMATVCASSLAMMDAGAPVRRAVSGIAMGLIKDGDDIAILSDILGDEDHLGDMDFKVAGTSEGITSLQMDIKIAGITRQIMEAALRQAHSGRLHILDEMKKALDASRDSVSDNAPRIATMTIPTDKIRDVIGTGGKIIRQIVEETTARINIEDDGTVTISAIDKTAIEAARDRIHALTAEPEVGAIYTGKVVKVMDFGAFVNFFGTRDGLVHISQLADRRVRQTLDVVSEGDQVKVKLLGIDPRGKVRLSMKVVDQATGEDLSEETSEPV